jgi:exosortase
MIHLPAGSLEVAEACSGIRSLYAFLALGALLARSVAIPIWGRILLFLVTIPLSVAGNALRVWSTGLGAHLVSPTAVTGVAHELFGVFVFAGGLFLFLLVRRGARALWSSAP